MSLAEKAGWLARIYAVVGVMQEALYWIARGKDFEVYETASIARGDPGCTFVIEKKLLD